MTRIRKLILLVSLGLVLVLGVATAIWVNQDRLGPNVIMVELSFPSWTPDGKEIIFGRNRVVDNGDANTHWNREVMKISADGGSPRMIVKDAWAPQCSRSLPLLAYVSGGGQRTTGLYVVETLYDLWILDLRTGKKWVLASVPPRSADISWSMSGDRVSYGGSPGCLEFVSDPYGKDVVDWHKKVFPAGLAGGPRMWFANWSWDGCIYAEGDPMEDPRPQGKEVFYRIDPARWQATPVSADDYEKANPSAGAEYAAAVAELPRHRSENAGNKAYVIYIGRMPSPDFKKVVYIEMREPAHGGVDIREWWGSRMWVYDRTTKKEKLLLDYSYLERRK